jgi:integrase
MESVLLDAAGRRRSPATMPGFHSGRAPRNKGLRYPPDPPSANEIIAVMRTVGDRPEGLRLRALIVVLWRAELRISEALLLAASDLDSVPGGGPGPSGKGGKRREGGLDRWGWEQLRPWLALRATLPVGASLCVLHGPTAGRPWAASSAREELRAAGVRRRLAPHQLRHAHAVEMSREGIPITVIQRQLGHADLGVTSVYLRGIDNHEIIDTVHERRAPVMSATREYVPVCSGHKTCAAASVVTASRPNSGASSADPTNTVEREAARARRQHSTRNARSHGVL